MCSQRLMQDPESMLTRFQVLMISTSQSLNLSQHWCRHKSFRLQIWVLLLICLLTIWVRPQTSQLHIRNFLKNSKTRRGFYVLKIRSATRWCSSTSINSELASWLLSRCNKSWRKPNSINNFVQRSGNFLIQSLMQFLRARCLILPCTSCIVNDRT